VYDVFDRERGIHVALKLLTRFDASTLYRFKSEFRSFADVQQHNLVQLYDLASADGDWFFTMELVAGTDWLSFVRGSRPRRFSDELSTMDPPNGDALADIESRRTEHAAPAYDVDRLFRGAHQLAAGVHALHEAGIVHRDVKPSNVLVEDGGRVVLVDFGLARPLASGRSTQTGVGGVGTPAYMAPEQAMGGEITAAADWYALGVMLFEALTGRLPYDGRALEIIAQKQTNDAPRVLHLSKDAPPELDALCSALLARDPTARPTGSMVLELLGAHRPKKRSIPAP
jgi:serine/threonine protein kinase